MTNEKPADTPMSIFTIGLVSLLFISASCGERNAKMRTGGQVTSNQEAARKQLHAAGIPYDQQNFYDRVKTGDEKSVQLFLTAGIDPNARYLANSTALMEAASIGNSAEVRLLIAGGADVNIVDDFGRSALTFAIQDGAHTDVVRLLLDGGADPNVKLKNGEMPLLLAVESPDIIKALLAKGADVNVRTVETGQTPLMLNVLAGDNISVKAILEKHPDINARDNRGVTALMFAANNKETEIVKLLLDSGADVNPKSTSGDTAISMAKKQQLPEMVKLLRKAGAQD